MLLGSLYRITCGIGWTTGILMAVDPESTILSHRKKSQGSGSVFREAPRGRRLRTM